MPYKWNTFKINKEMGDFVGICKFSNVTGGEGENGTDQTWTTLKVYFLKSHCAQHVKAYLKNKNT